MLRRAKINPRVLLNYTRQHPLRPVNWRWRRALRLVRDGKWPIARADDPWTIEAYHYADTIEHLTGKYRFPDRMIDIHAAYKLSKADSPRLWELEARILAQEHVDVVARKTGVPADTVRAYAATFFDVGPKIHARGHIQAIVIGSRRPWTPTRVRDLWCHFGYMGGPLVLDTIIEHFKQAGEPDYSYLLKPLGPQRSQSELERSINSLLRLMLLEKTDKHVKALTEMNATVAATEKELAVPLAEEAFDNSLQQAINTSLATVPLMDESNTFLDQSGAA